jgi:hypothetical protein
MAAAYLDAVASTLAQSWATEISRPIHACRAHSVHRENTMTRVSLGMVGVGLCITVGLLTATPGYSASPEKHPPEAHAGKCTLHTLKGRYLFGGISAMLPQAPEQQQSLFAVAGLRLFNGDGTGTDLVTVSINGAVVAENAIFPFTYTVNPDCSGTLTVPASKETFGLFIAPTGDELIVIGTTAGAVLVHGPSRRVSRQ